MGGKQGLGPHLPGAGHIFQHRPGDTHTVIGGSAPADLVEDDQAVRRGILEDRSHLAHLHHKVDCPDARSSEAPTR